MKKVVLIIIAIFSGYISYAQMIDNKVNIYFGYYFGSLHGKEIIKDGNFSSPSLYANYKNLNGETFKVLVKKSQFFSLGLGAEYSNASDWELNRYSNYSDSKTKQFTLSPIIQFHDKFRKTGISNLVRPYIEIAPIIGCSNLTLSKPLFDIQSTYTNFSQQMDINNIYFAIKGSAGLDITISRILGFYIAYSYQQNWINSKFYFDQNFSNSQLGLGIFLRFKNDKRYFYY